MTVILFFSHELYHQCGHLVDYVTFLVKNRDTAILWNENFKRTFKREFDMFIKLADSTDPNLQALEKLHKDVSDDLDERSRQVSHLLCQLRLSNSPPINQPI